MVLEHKKILITGGAGFIGSNLVQKFLNQNNTVVCLDNFLTGFKENIEAFFLSPNFTFIEGDICNMPDCRKAVEGVDIVLHQAALGSVPRSINNPQATNEVNISGFLNMLVAARDAGVKRFVYAASSSTYGDNYNLPKVEEHIGKPLSPYAVTKLVNELYADVFAKTYGIEVIGLRYFNVFGPRQTPDGAYAAVIPKFIKQILNGESPVINGDGTFSRDFTYIENVLHANELAAMVQNQAALNQVYNVAFGANTSLIQLVDAIKNSLSKYDSRVLNVNPVFGPNREGDIPHSLASIEKAKKMLGYNPQYSLEQGLEKAIDWYWQYFTKKL
jgi:UDP-N-acetylglucosamine/UDP-N-acetylgalactosamine 4-epimerase